GAIIEADVWLDVALLLDVAGRTDERDVGDAGLSIFCNGPIGADPPVELVPRPDRVKHPGRYSIRPARHRILLAPQVVEGADSDAETVDQTILVLVKVERQSVDDLRGQAGIGDQQPARRDVVVREG